MIDKKISIGTVITILTVLGTFIYTQGVMTNKMESFEVEDSKNTMKISNNKDDIVDLQISVAKIEAKIDEGFKRLETLLIEN
jgi:hypothetical protein